MGTEKDRAAWKKRLTIGAVIYALLLLSLLIIANNQRLHAWIMSVIRLLRPVLIGLLISYLCNPVFRFLEQKVFLGIRKKSPRRALSLVCSYLLLLLVVLSVFWLILPQLIDSLSTFLSNYTLHVSVAIDRLNGLIAGINRMYGAVTGNATLIQPLAEETLYGFFQNVFDKIDASDLSDFLSSNNFLYFTDGIGRVVSALTDIFLGLFISIYLLSSKEKRYVQILKLRVALFGDKGNERISHLCGTADRCFGKFVRGKLWDSFIVGLLFYVAFLLAGVPYAILVATILALANIIPFVGIFIGAIPSALIILFVSPSKIWIFLLIVFLVQLLDTNVIAPKIVGTNIGVSSLCVVIAVTTMTAFWGFWGAILGVPLFATVLELLDLWTVEKLQKKGLPSGVESYYPTHATIDPIADADVTTRKMQRRLEEFVLLANKKKREQGASALSRRERFGIRLYQFAKNRRIIPEVTDEVNLHVSVKSAYKQALAKSNERMNADEADNAKASDGATK